MRKRKFTFVVNIAVLVLCLCAIAFGVYSAKNANLNVSGTVGFNSHNCDVDVTAYIYGDSAVEDTSTANASESGVVRSEKNKKVLGSAQVKGDSDKTISLGNIYFCDMTVDDTIAPIYIVFELTNQSIFNVDISATTTFTPANENITATNSGVVTLKDKSAQSADKKKELIVTLTLETNSSDFNSTNISIKLNMYKSESFTYNTIAEKNYHEFKIQKRELFNLYQNFENSADYNLDNFLDDLNQNQSLFTNTGFASLYTKLYNSDYENIRTLSILDIDSTYYEGQSTAESGIIDLYYEEGLYPVKNGNNYSFTLYCGSVKDWVKCAILALNFETYNFVLYEISDENYDSQYGKITITNCSYLPFVCMVLAY